MSKKLSVYPRIKIRFYQTQGKRTPSQYDACEIDESALTRRTTKREQYFQKNEVQFLI